jgi:hypothetical protein
MSLILAVGMVACSAPATEVKADSTAPVAVDTTATQVVDTASVVK